MIQGKNKNGLRLNFLFEVSKAEELSLLCIEKNANTPKARFGLSWFIPSIKKHKGALAQVVITSFFVQLLGFSIHY